MYETTGALTIVEPSSYLVFLVVLPLLVNIGVLTAGRRPSLVARIALAGSAGTLAFAVIVAVETAAAGRHGARHVLGQHLATVARTGQLDLTFDLECDALAAVAVVTVSAIALASVLRSLWADRVHRGMAFVALLAAGANLVFLAEGIAPLAIGLGVTTVSAFVVARGASIPAMTTALAADACAVFSFFFLYWALGGSFSASTGYEPEAHARFVLVAAPMPPIGARAYLAMSTHPGAMVTVDDGPPLPNEPLRAPFVVEVEPSVYTFRISSFAGGQETVVPRVQLAAGRAYTLAPYGPTASLRSLVDQISVPRPLATGGTIDARSLLATRSIAGLRATFIIAVLLASALAARLFVAASRRRALPLAITIEAVVPAFVALRFAPLLDPHAVDGMTFAGAGVVVGLVCAGHAAASRDPFAVSRGVLAATSALVLAGAGLGAAAGGLVVLVAAGLSGTAALAAVEARRDVRWLGIACAAAVGLLPFSGISAGVAAMLARALDPAAPSRAAGIALAFGVAVVVVLAAVAAFRMHDAIVAGPRGEPRGDAGTHATRTLALVLSSVALASGVVLGIGSSAFGGRLVPLAVRMLGEPAKDVGDAWSGVSLAIVAPAVGLFLARRPWRTSEPFAVAERPARALRRAASAAARLARFLGNGATILDRDVIARTGDLGACALLGAARAVARADDAVRIRLAREPLGRLSDVAVTRLGLDHPRVAARLGAVAILVMVALLALVVLSSVLLG